MPLTGAGLCARPRSTPPSRHASQWSMVEVAQRYVAVYERVLAQSGPVR